MSLDTSTAAVEAKALSSVACGLVDTARLLRALAAERDGLQRMIDGFEEALRLTVERADAAEACAGARGARR
jgi:hypothetical protein